MKIRIIPDPIAVNMGRKILKSVNRDLCADVGVSSSKLVACGSGVAVGFSVLFGFEVVVGLVVRIAVGVGVFLTVGVGVGFAVGAWVGPVAMVKFNGIIAREAALDLPGAVGATASCLNW